MPMMQTRRRFMNDAALADAANVAPALRARAAKPPPETTTVRLAKQPIICFAPQYILEKLLQTKNFAEIRYVNITLPATSKKLGRGHIDFASSLSVNHIIGID